MSELTDAIKQGDTAKINELLDGDPSLASAVESDVTPILLAIYHGKRDIAQLLAERSTAVSFPEAVALGDQNRIERLLDADSQLIHSRTADGHAAIGLAIFFGHGELARWLIDKGADINAVSANEQKVAAVHAAAAVRDRETMRVLLERGADPNARQQADHTPLHGAASRGDIEMAKLLLAHGADADAKAADGLGIADIARKYGQPDFAEWFETR